MSTPFHEPVSSERQLDDAVESRAAWRRFRRQQARRLQAYYHPARQQHKPTDRLYLLSNDHPARIFERDQQWQLHAWVRDVSAIHFSPLHSACAYGDLRDVEKLLAEGYCPLARDNSLRIPLHHAVIRERHHFVQRLRQQPDWPMQVHARDHRGMTPVHYVLDKMERLAKKAVPGCQPHRIGSTMQSRSIRYKMLWDLVDQMIDVMDSKAVIELEGRDCAVRGDVWAAIEAGDLQRLQRIQDLYHHDSNPPHLGELGITMLHAACHSCNQNRAIIYHLVASAGIRIDHQDQSGKTALHYAAESGNLEVCAALLDATTEGDGAGNLSTDALLMVQDKRDRTALHLAALLNPNKGATPLAKYLASANPCALFVMDDEKRSPMHYAIIAGNLELVNCFVSLGADLSGNREAQDPKNFKRTATWAPCRNHLPRQRTRELNSQHFTQANGAEKSTVFSHTHSEFRRPELLREHPTACTRLKHVKSGAVDHPGEVTPMETLWFWVKRRQPPQHDLCVSSTSNDLSNSIVESNHVSDDPRGYGCRRLGGICERCRVAPGEDSASDHHNDPCKAPTQLSPLALALRMLKIRSDFPNERRRIISELVENGASFDQDCIRELLRRSHIFFDNGTTHLLDKCPNSIYSSLITSLWPLQTDLDAATNVHLCKTVLDCLPDQQRSMFYQCLFQLKHFDLIESIVLQSPDEQLADAINMVFEGRSIRLPSRPTVDMDHVTFLVSMRESAHPDSSNYAKWLHLAEMCTMNVLQQHRLMACGQAVSIDKKLIECIPVLLRSCVGVNNCHSIRHEPLRRPVMWIRLMLKNCFIGSACKAMEMLTSDGCKWCLLDVFSSVSSYQAREHAAWRAHVVDYVKSLQSLHRDDLKSKPTSVQMGTTLAVACIFELEEAAIVAGITQAFTICAFDELAEFLITHRVLGHTVVEHIVIRRRSSALKALLDFGRPRSAVRSKLERFAVASIIGFHKEDPRTWDATSDLGLELDSIEYLVSTRIIPRDAPAALKWALEMTSQYLRRGCKKDEESTCEDQKLLQWLDSIHILALVARWNAISCLKFLQDRFCDDSNHWKDMATALDELYGCSPLELSELFGHPLHHVFKPLHSYSQVWGDLHSRNTGILGKLLRDLKHTPSTDTTIAMVPRQPKHGDVSECVVNNWKLAASTNAPPILDAMAEYDVKMSLSSVYSELITIAIRHCAGATLTWLLSSPYTAECRASWRVSADASAALTMAAKHTSDGFATIVNLLLDAGVGPGRLAGDGSDVTLLHRVACLQEPDSAISLLARLLAIEGSDVNTRDGFGWTPVAYAFAAGRLSVACFLIRVHGARLEAEYEGQSAFYYLLHLLPSFAWRWVIASVLRTYRRRAHLHCRTGDCPCKGFEVDDHADVGAPCRFCEHAADAHDHLPHPPWFRDQYETYDVAPNCPETSVNRDNDAADDGDDDESTAIGAMGVDAAAGLLDERDVEDTRGRLHVGDLLGLVRLRCGRALAESGLPLPSPTTTDAVDVDGESKPVSSPAAAAAAPLTCDDEDAVDGGGAGACGGPGDSPSPPVAPFGSSPTLGRPPHMTPVLIPTSSPPPFDLIQYPHFLRADLAKLHRPDCIACGGARGRGGGGGEERRGGAAPPPPRLHRWLSPESRRQLVLGRWLEHLANSLVTCGVAHEERVRGLIDRASDDVDDQAKIRWAMRIWRGDRTTTSTFGDEVTMSRDGDGDTSPCLLRLPPPDLACGPVPLAKQSNDLLKKASTILPQKLPLQNAKVSILQLFVFHWRYAKVFQAFWRWKHWRRNEQVIQHKLQSLADAWAADERRRKLASLLARQRALEEEIHQSGLSTC